MEMLFKRKLWLTLVVVLGAMLIVAHDTTYAGSNGFAWCCGDWSARIAWEAEYALYSYDYVASDPYAFEKASSEAGSIVGTVGPGKGGWCTFFVRLVLYRSTYWAGYGQHLTTPGYPGSVYSWCNSSNMTQDYSSASPGWVISSPNFHMGFLYHRTKSGGNWGWYVIDSNWVGGNGSFKIAKHFMSDSDLKRYGFWAWWPSWATTN